MNESSERATQLLKKHEDQLHTVSEAQSLETADAWQLAKALVEYETLSLDEVRTVLQGRKLEREAELGPDKDKLA